MSFPAVALIPSIYQLTETLIRLQTIPFTKATVITVRRVIKGFAFMTRKHQNFGVLGQESPTTDGSLVPALVIAVAIPALIVIVDFPVIVASLVVGVSLGVLVLWIGLAAIARTPSSRFDKLDVPGVGTVEVRIIHR